MNKIEGYMHLRPFKAMVLWLIKFKLSAYHELSWTPADAVSFAPR